MRIRYFLITAVLATAILCSTGSVGATTTTDTSALIAQLQAQIASLLAQIKALQAQQGTTTIWCHTFNTNLGIGSVGDEVAALKEALIKEGLYSGVHITIGSTYGEEVASAVSAFQQKYASEILTPSGLKYPTGYVGPATRKKLNALYGCGITNCPGELPNCLVGTIPKSYVGTDGCTHWKCVPQITQCQINADCPSMCPLCATGSTTCGGCITYKCLNGKCVENTKPVWQIYTSTQYGFSIKYPSNYPPTTDIYGWPHSIVLFNGPSGQSYYLAIEVWNNQSDFYTSYPGVQPIFKQVGNQYLSLWNINKDSIVDQMISSFVLTNQPPITCPQYSPPAPGWCSGGTILPPVMGKDGCYGPARCSLNNITINSVSGPNSLNIGQTGTWAVNATAPNGINLTYSVDWGDNMLYPYSATSGLKTEVKQTSTFTHSYSQAGKYTVKFTVSGPSVCPACPAGMVCQLEPCIPNSAQTSITVVVGSTTQPLTVSSVKIIGDQTAYTAGQTIKFSVTGTVSDGSIAKPEKGFHIQAWMQTSTETVMIGGIYQSFNAVYNLATGYWDVTMTAPSDSSQIYKIEAALYCANSNYGCSFGQIIKSFNFKITSIIQPSTITINSVSGPNSLNVSQTGTWTINASAPSGTNLTYSVDWGDMVYPTGVGVGSANVNQTSTFTHSYSQAGTYTIRFKVIDSNVCTVTASCDKSAQASMTVVVGGYNNVLSITGPSDLSGTVGLSYNKTFSVSQSVTNSNRHYTWSVTNGVLPAGLQLLNRMIACSQALCVTGQYCPPCPDGSNMVVISGTPTQVGDFPFTLVVTDDLGNRGSDNLKISIGSTVCAQDVYACPNGLMVGRTGQNCEFICPTTACSNLYWLDNTSKTCQTQKQFCGAYMYYGLQTFNNQQDCLNAVTY